jgi:hypothetical protein
MLDGSGWKDGAALLSAIVAAGSFVTGLGTLTAQSRLRSNLSTEVEVWSKLPAGDAKLDLQRAVERSASRLARLQEPGVVRERRRVAAFLLAFAVVCGAVAYWTYRTDGVHGLVGLGAPVAAVLVKLGYQWLSPTHAPEPDDEVEAAAGA